MAGVGLAATRPRCGFRPAIRILILNGHDRAHQQAARIAAEG
jgi:hypothetical protein